MNELTLVDLEQERAELLPDRQTLSKTRSVSQYFTVNAINIAFASSGATAVAVQVFNIVPFVL